MTLRARRFQYDPKTDMLHDTQGEIEPFAYSRIDEMAKTMINAALEHIVRAISKHQG